MATAVATAGVTGNVVMAALEPTLTDDQPFAELVSSAVHTSAVRFVIVSVKFVVAPVIVTVPPDGVVIVEPETVKSLGILLAVISWEFKLTVP